MPAPRTNPEGSNIDDEDEAFLVPKAWDHSPEDFSKCLQAAWAVCQQPASGPVPNLLCRVMLQKCELTDVALSILVQDALTRGWAPQKLWLNHNRLTDRSSESMAKLFCREGISSRTPAVCEIHLSHNGMTSRGARTLLMAAHRSKWYPMKPEMWQRGSPASSSTIVHRSSKQHMPLWCRLEYNLIRDSQGLVKDLEKLGPICQNQRCKCDRCVDDSRWPWLHLPHLHNQKRTRVVLTPGIAGAENEEEENEDSLEDWRQENSRWNGWEARNGKWTDESENEDHTWRESNRSNETWVKSNVELKPAAEIGGGLRRPVTLKPGIALRSATPRRYQGEEKKGGQESRRKQRSNERQHSNGRSKTKERRKSRERRQSNQQHEKKLSQERQQWRRSRDRHSSTKIKPTRYHPSQRSRSRERLWPHKSPDHEKEASEPAWLTNVDRRSRSGKNKDRDSRTAAKKFKRSRSIQRSNIAKHSEMDSRSAKSSRTDLYDRKGSGLLAQDEEDSQVTPARDLSSSPEKSKPWPKGKSLPPWRRENPAIPSSESDSEPLSDLTESSPGPR